MNRLYFKSTIETVSPLKTASGRDDHTDSDILVGADGKPFIPGTTLAGIIRHYLESFTFPKYDVDSWFGYTNKNEGENSRITFYDAVLSDASEKRISRRDGVRLDDDKTAVNGGKFDYEVTEAGASFVLRFEVDLGGMNEPEFIDKIFNGFNSGDIRIGGKTTRGFGLVKLVDISRCVVDNVTDYINFDWKESKFESYLPQSDSSISLYETKEYNFDVTAFLHIRDYATLVKNNVTQNVVNSEQLESSGKPVIPGTSWAGAFRHHAKKILTASGKSEGEATKLINNWFGCLNESDKDNTNMSVSKVIFSESSIDGSTQLVRTRNAIDRFTGGAGDKKLFSDSASFGGNGSLTIKIKNDATELELLKSVIDVCIDDINEGLLAVGGSTSIGGGILKRSAE